MRNGDTYQTLPLVPVTSKCPMHFADLKFALGSSHNLISSAVAELTSALVEPDYLYAVVNYSLLLVAVEVAFSLS